jgi:P27 family predicted phage terminase small subunit
VKGRKAIPSKITELRGGARHTHRPPRDQEPKPPEGMPPCPDHLDEKAKKEWERAGAILQNIGLMTELDMAVLAGYCDAYSRWAKATVEVQSKGMVYVEGAKKDKETGKMVGGIPKLNPYLRVAREAYDCMMKAAVLIGLSPSSRASLKVEKPKPKGRVELFMVRKNGDTTHNKAKTIYHKKNPLMECHKCGSTKMCRHKTGSKGGKKSRRILTPEQARKMNEAKKVKKNGASG